MKKIAKQKELLKFLATRKPQVRKRLLKEADKDFCEAIVELIVNLLKGNIKLSSKQKLGFQKHKKLLRSIYNNYYNPKTNRIRKRKINKKQIIQVGGVLPLFIPLIAGIIGKAALAGAASAGTAYATKKIIEKVGG